MKLYQRKLSIVSLSLLGILQACSNTDRGFTSVPDEQHGNPDNPIQVSKSLTTYITSWAGYSQDKNYQTYGGHNSYKDEYSNSTPIENYDMVQKANESDVIAYAFFQAWNPSFEQEVRGRMVPKEWAGHLHAYDLWGDFPNRKVSDFQKFNSFCSSSAVVNGESPECSAFNMGNQLRQYLKPANSDIYYGEGQLDNFGAFTRLDTNAKKVISIGGANTIQNKGISSVTFNSIFENQKTFLDSLALWVNNSEFHLSGVDYDLEPPIDISTGVQLVPNQNRIDSDYGNLFKLIQGTRSKLGRDAYIAITLTVNKDYLGMINKAPAENGSGSWFKDISPYVDAINIMTYDMHGPWDTSADPGAVSHVMLERPGANILDSNKYAINYTVDEIVDMVLAYGVDASKVQVGIASYGRGFANVPQGNNTDLPGFGQSWSGSSKFDAKYTNGEDMLPYKSVLNVMNNLSYKTYDVKNKNEDVIASYIYNPVARQLVGYESPAMIDTTCRLIRDKNIKGAILWSMDTDAASSESNSLSLVDRYNNVCRK